ncbi:hypothetical protein H7R52_17890 [Weissella confusa]|uniref:Uncharacterized protein n=1 Tax=Weissella confusa TaxID=1583 RepID=A0A923NK63_WEICO|nr:hypothetical protein [Weissella confusa]
MAYTKQEVQDWVKKLDLNTWGPTEVYWSALMSRLWTGFFGTERYRTPKIFQNPVLIPDDATFPAVDYDKLKEQYRNGEL